MTKRIFFVVLLTMFIVSLTTMFKLLYDADKSARELSELCIAKGGQLVKVDRGHIVCAKLEMLP